MKQLGLTGRGATLEGEVDAVSVPGAGLPQAPSFPLHPGYMGPLKEIMKENKNNSYE